MSPEFARLPSCPPLTFILPPPAAGVIEVADAIRLLPADAFITLALTLSSAAELRCHYFRCRAFAAMLTLLLICHLVYYFDATLRRSALRASGVAIRR